MHCHTIIRRRWGREIAVNLANQYVKEGHQVSLIVFSGFGPYKKQVSIEVDVVDLAVKRVRHAFFHCSLLFED